MEELEAQERQSSKRTNVGSLRLAKVRKVAPGAASSHQWVADEPAEDCGNSWGWDLEALLQRPRPCSAIARWFRKQS